MSLFELFCVIPAFLILVTALARLNDIKKTQTQKRWWIRRVGLLLVFVGMVLFIGGFFFTYATGWRQIMALCSLWGVLLTWMTTPGMPPWHKYIARNDAVDQGTTT